MTRLISPSVHPDTVSRHVGRDPATNGILRDDALIALVEAAKTNYEICLKAADTFSKIMNNKMATPLANEKRAREVLFQMQQTAAKKTDLAVSFAAIAHEGELKKLATPKAKNIDEATVFSDIRTALSRMPASERRKAVKAAIEADDDVVVFAVLGAPSLVSGFSRPETDAIRSDYEHKRHPEAVARAGRLDRAMNDLLRGGQALVGYCNSFTSAERIAEAARSEADANNAVAD